MRISIKVKPGSRITSVEKTAEGGYLVKVRARAQGGMANKALIGVLSEYFKVPKSRISIERGLGSKHKIVEIS